MNKGYGDDYDNNDKPKKKNSSSTTDSILFS